MGVTNKTDRTIGTDGSTAGYVRWFVNHTTDLRRTLSWGQALLLLLLSLSSIHHALLPTVKLSPEMIKNHHTRL